jgi:hypothetical protein
MGTYDGAVLTEASQGDGVAPAQISRILGVAALLSAAAVLAASVIQGPPDSTPAVALGWPLLLYLERAALVAAIIMGIGGTADRLLRGDAVQGFSAPGGPGVQIAEQTAVTAERAAEADEALKEAVDEGFKELDERVARLEDRA